MYWLDVGDVGVDLMDELVLSLGDNEFESQLMLLFLLWWLLDEVFDEQTELVRELISSLFVSIVLFEFNLNVDEEHDDDDFKSVVFIFSAIDTNWFCPSSSSTSTTSCSYT